jgi:hypothetical protein
MLTIVQFDQQAIQTGTWLPDELPKAYERFKTDGCLWLKGVFPPAYLNELRAIFLEEYGPYFNPGGESYSRALEVGDKRLMIPVEIKGAFNNPTLYAHPLICSFMKQALGDDFKLGGFGAVVSLPGALDQHIHRDHPALFGTMIDDFLPNFAVTMIVPLVDSNEISGTTRVWKGSHFARYHVVNSGTEFDKRDYQDPYAGVGDCLLMDYRLYHSGLANRSDKVRPILYVTYFRPWFKDYVNYRNHHPLLVDEAEYEKAPPHYRPLFSNAIIRRTA